MPLARYQAPWKRQPPAPKVNWADPITDGLVGLIWVGNGYYSELVCPGYVLGVAGVTFEPRKDGVASITATGGNKGIYSPRKDYNGWNIANAPLSLLVFNNHVSTASSRPLAGVYGSADGYAIWELFGSRDRMCRAYIGGAARDATGGVWASIPTVKGFSATATGIDGYEAGVRFGGSTYSTTSTIKYDPTFPRAYIHGSPDASGTGGEAFWMAVWNRVLSPAEHLRIGLDPWCMLEPQIVRIPISVAGGDVSTALTGASASTAQGTTAASIGVSLTGVSATTAAGTVSAGSDVTQALTGISSTAASGTLAASISTVLAGVSATTAAGTLAASTSAALTGVSSTAATGTTAASDTVSLAGASATATAGTLSAGGDASAAVTGQAASTAQGTLGVTASGSAVLSGASVSTDAGTITATTGAVAALSGADAAVVTGTLAPTTSVVLTGAAAVVAAGDILVTVPTVGRPASDTSNSGWVPSTGSDLYAMLDEVAPDALDYIVATSIGALCELELDTTAYPGTASQTLKYRASSSTGNSVIVRLKNTGGATIRTETQALTSVDTEYSIALTAPEIAAITSGALSVQLESA